MGFEANYKRRGEEFRPLFGAAKTDVSDYRPVIVRMLILLKRC